MSFWLRTIRKETGGGYADRRLSDLTLGWIQDKASALGLAVDAVPVGEKNYLGEATDSYGKFLGGLYARKNARHYRVIGATKFGNEAVDDSVQRRRQQDREYEPQNDGLPKVN